MLIRVFEALQPLLEISLERTKQEWFKKLVARVSADHSFYIEELNEPTEDQIFEVAYDGILKSDPTTGEANKPSRYTLWIISRYCNGGIRLWEDLDTIKELLAKYENLKKRSVFQRMMEDPEIEARDAGLKHYYEIYRDIMKIRDKGTLFDAVQAGEKWLKKRDAATQSERFAFFCKDPEVTVYFPDMSKPDNEALADFVKYGAVLTMWTVEASVRLFQSDTAWCTARPDNEYFDEYNSPDSPLVAIIDNKNDKLYQFHLESDQFLDESDEPDFDVMAIPFRLIHSASIAADVNENIVFKVAGMDLPQLLPILIKNEKKPIPNIHEKVWELYEQEPWNFNSSELSAILTMYTTAVGQPPNQLWIENSIGRLIEDYQDKLLGHAGTFLAHIKANDAAEKYDSRFWEMMLDVSKGFPTLLIDFFHGTPLWPQARNYVLASVFDPLKINMLWDASYFNSVRTEYAGNHRVSDSDIFDAMEFTEEEIDRILSLPLRQYSKTPQQILSILFFNHCYPSLDGMKSFIGKLQSPMNAYVLYLVYREIIKGAKHFCALIDVPFLVNGLSSWNDPTDTEFWYLRIFSTPELNEQVHDKIVFYMFNVSLGFAILSKLRSHPYFIERMKDARFAEAVYGGLAASIPNSETYTNYFHLGADEIFRQILTTNNIAAFASQAETVAANRTLIYFSLLQLFAERAIENKCASPKNEVLALVLGKVLDLMIDRRKYNTLYDEMIETIAISGYRIPVDFWQTMIDSGWGPNVWAIAFRLRNKVRLPPPIMNQIVPPDAPEEQRF